MAFRERRRIRTFDRLLRRQVLYPAELCVHFFKLTVKFLSGWQDSNLRPPAPKAGAITGLRYAPMIKNPSGEAVREGFEPSVQFNPYDGLANRSFRPLRHLTSILLGVAKISVFTITSQMDFVSTKNPEL